MKAYIIESGHFSEAGNFIGYTSLGERVHIYRKQIFEGFPMVEIYNRHFGIYDKSWIKFPFYCLAQERSFTNARGSQFTRLTAEQISTNKFKLKLSLMDGCQEWSKQENVYDTVMERKIDHLLKVYDNLKSNYAKLKEDKDQLADQLLELHTTHQYTKAKCDRLQRLCNEHEQTISKIKDLIK